MRDPLKKKRIRVSLEVTKMEYFQEFWKIPWTQRWVYIPMVTQLAPLIVVSLRHDLERESEELSQYHNPEERKKALHEMLVKQGSPLIKVGLVSKEKLSSKTAKAKGSISQVKAI